MSRDRVTYFAVQPYSRGPKGHVIRGEATEAPNARAAISRARKLARSGYSALAFSRSGDPELGHWDDAEILEVTGDIPQTAMLALAETNA